MNLLHRKRSLRALVRTFMVVLAYLLTHRYLPLEGWQGVLISVLIVFALDLLAVRVMKLSGVRGYFYGQPDEQKGD